MATGPKEGWGGKREGSGRKRSALSDAQVKKLLRAAKIKEKETGKSVADQLMAIIYGKKSEVKVKERIAAVKVFYDQTITSASEQDVNVTKNKEPSIYLPEQMPDPAKLVSIKGGKS
jgi:hypothetical protein